MMGDVEEQVMGAMAAPMAAALDQSQKALQLSAVQAFAETALACHQMNELELKRQALVLLKAALDGFTQATRQQPQE